MPVGGVLNKGCLTEGVTFRSCIWWLVSTTLHRACEQLVANCRLTEAVSSTGIYVRFENRRRNKDPGINIAAADVDTGVLSDGSKVSILPLYVLVVKILGVLWNLKDGYHNQRRVESELSPSVLGRSTKFSVQTMG